MAAYCAITDLLVGDLVLGSDVDPQKFVDAAADEINARLGHVYVVPFTFSALALHSQLTLKRINAHLATGRLIMAVAAGGENVALHAYGASMVKSAEDDIYMILSGGYLLTGADQVASGASGNAPECLNVDASSGVEHFYANFGRRRGFPFFPSPWQPGNPNA